MLLPLLQNNLLGVVQPLATLDIDTFVLVLVESSLVPSGPPDPLLLDVMVLRTAPAELVSVVTSTADLLTLDVGYVRKAPVEASSGSLDHSTYPVLDSIRVDEIGVK